MDYLACSESGTALSNPLSPIFLERGKFELLSESFDPDLSNCCRGAMAVQALAERAVNAVGSPGDFIPARLRGRTLSSGRIGVDSFDRYCDMADTPYLCETTNFCAV